MNKGFTLIELLAVITILGVLAFITIASMDSTLEDSKNELTDIQINNIKETANVYYLKHGVGLDDSELENPRDCINVSELIESGYLENEEITNPKTEEKILGSVKVTYNSNNYIYEYQDNACTNYDKGIICERVESTELGSVPEGNFIAGDAYNCKVDPNKEPYKFYILTTPEKDSDMVNLIMDRNINSDGTPVIKAIKEENAENGVYNLVEWINQDDYLSSGGISTDWEAQTRNNKGPITAMNFLQEATKNWTNVTEMIVDTFSDETGIQYKMKSYKTHAKMPYFTEVGDSNGTNEYLYEYLNGIFWWGAGTQPTNNISGIDGYWTLSVSTSTAEVAFKVSFGKVDIGGSVGYVDSTIFGVRPVISVYKFQME